MSDADWTPIPPRSGHTLGKQCRDLTVDVLAALGADGVAVDGWDTESNDSYTSSWPGEQLGPTTRTVHTARLGGAGDVSASVAVETIRWSPDDVTFVEVSARWRVGEARASVWARGQKTAPVESAAIHGDGTAHGLLLAALTAPQP